MTTAAGTTAAAMTEPVSPAAAERLAALRAPSKERGRPAHTWKILTAGMSTSAMFGLVAAMGWGGTAQSTALPPDTAVQIVPSAPVATIPVATIPVATPVTTVAPPGVTPAAAPVIPATEPPTTAAPVAIPVAVPAPQAQPTKRSVTNKAASNTATKSSS